MPREETSPISINPRGVGRLIAIGGGRGGAGKSLLTVNLGVYLAQLGRSVVIADLDPAGANLHAMLGLETAPSPATEDGPVEASAPVATPIPGLRLLPPAHDGSAATSLRPAKKARLLQRLRGLPFDYILLDLGSGISTAALDLFLAADVGLCVTVPEPPAIEATYVFLRALFLRRLRRVLVKERFKLRLVERAMAELPALPSPLEVIAAITRFDTTVAGLAAGELGRMHPRFIVNQTRVKTDLDVGPSMRAIAGRYLGVDLDYLGHVEHDDAVWLTVRRRRPLLIDSPTSKAARNVERIARRMLALVATREARPEVASSSLAPRRPTHYDSLGVPRGASDEEVRRAYKRQRELYAPGSLPLASILWGDELLREQSLIEEAHDTLLDPVRRRSYDLSTFPEAEAASEPLGEGEPQGVAEELVMLQAELAREISAETQFTGGLLRKVRESQGVELVDVASHTKISMMHLRAIEEEAFADLPALVYTRGFLQELAKVLSLDPSQVARSYLSRMREALAASGRTLA